MNRLLVLRLVLDAIAAGLFLVGLAYWWLSNTVHEIVGLSMFLLIIGHNVFNRRVYGAVGRGRHDWRRILNLGVVFSLLGTMLILLVTSVMISRDLFGFLGIDSSYTTREIHMLAGYWVLLILSVHLGTRWWTVMKIARGTLGVVTTSPIRTGILRAIAAAIAICGLRSCFEMAFGSKLILRYTLDMWDFNESVSGFFLNYASIIGSFVVVTHYAMVWRPRRERSV